ncbi:MAG: dolichol-phosphate mannosyltransferase [Acidimicrobiia bacterium]
MSLRVLACAVAFNEKAKIERVVARALESPLPGVTEFMVCDDGSTDGTAEAVERHGVGVIRQPQRQGVGAAIRRVIEYARAHHFDIVVIMAGNDKDRPSEIPKLLAPILAGRADFVQGSRYLKGGNYGNMPFYRRIATQWLHPLLFSLVTRHHITDSTNGFRAFRTTLCQDPRINLAQAWLDAYELEPYLFYKALTLGYRVVEVPVTKIYPPRELGYTKMAPVTGWWSILRPIFLLAFRLKR